MKAVLSRAYITSSPSVGSAKLLNVISLGTVKTLVFARTTPAQELIAALGRIQTTTASFFALNMASPLIKSLNLDLIMRRHNNPFDQFNLDDTLFGFELKKAFEDIPQLSDIAGKFVDKAPFLDYFSTVEHNKNQPMKRLDDIAFARASLLPFKVEKGLVDVLSFDEDVYLKWDASLILPHIAELDDNDYRFLGKRLETFVSTYDVVEPVRALRKEEVAELFSFLSRDTRLSLGDEADVKDVSKEQTLKMLSSAFELSEVRDVIRPVIAQDATDFEITTKKLLEIGIKRFKTPLLEYRSNNNYNYRKWTSSTYPANISNSKFEGTGPFTDRDTELAIIESSRWHNNEFPGVGASFNIASPLNDEAAFDEIVYPSRIVYAEDATDFDETAKKLLHIGLTKYKRPFYHIQSGMRYQWYSTDLYTNSNNSPLTRRAGTGPFTDRDTDLAVIEAGRSHNNEIKGVGISLQPFKRLNDEAEVNETVDAVKIHFTRDTVNAEHLIGRNLTADFIRPRSFTLQGNNKIWSDGATVQVYIQGPAIYTYEYTSIDEWTYSFLLGYGGASNLYEVYLGESVGSPYPYVRRTRILSGYEQGYWVSVPTGITKTNNSRLTERDTELLSVYAGRDQLAFGLPLRIEPELFSASVDYVLPIKVVYTKEQKAILEADISDLFIDLKVINYGTRFVSVPFPGTSYSLPYAEVDTAFVEEKAGKFTDKATFLEGITSTVEVLPTKVALPEPELFTALANIDSKNIFIKPRKYKTTFIPFSGDNVGNSNYWLREYLEFTAELTVKNNNDMLKELKEHINTTVKSDAFRPVFGFELFKVSETDEKEIQKSTTEELLSIISDFYRKVSYRRDYQVENALADDTFSAFSQNYSSGYFSQAYVGETIIGD